MPFPVVGGVPVLAGIDVTLRSCQLGCGGAWAAALVAAQDADKVPEVTRAQPDAPAREPFSTGSTVLAAELHGELWAAAVLERVSKIAAVRDLSIEEPDIEDVVRRLYLSSGR